MCINIEDLGLELELGSVLLKKLKSSDLAGYAKKMKV